MTQSSGRAGHTISRKAGWGFVTGTWWYLPQGQRFGAKWQKRGGSLSIGLFGSKPLPNSELWWPKSSQRLIQRQLCQREQRVYFSTHREAQERLQHSPGEGKDSFSLEIAGDMQSFPNSAHDPGHFLWITCRWWGDHFMFEDTW